MLQRNSALLNVNSYLKQQLAALKFVKKPRRFLGAALVKKICGLQVQRVPDYDYSHTFQRFSVLYMCSCRPSHIKAFAKLWSKILKQHFLVFHFPQSLVQKVGAFANPAQLFSNFMVSNGFLAAQSSPGKTNALVFDFWTPMNYRVRCYWRGAYP